MLKKTVTIINKLGLHARAATKLVRLASSFESDVLLKRQQREVNGKSIMGVMLLAAAKGVDIELIVSGADEETALNELSALIEDKFGEEQ